jgi:two-component system sensor histidine kinase AlgZ
LEKRDFNRRRDTLPNFARLGVGLRAALITEAALVFVAASARADWSAFSFYFLDLSALAQPVLLLCLLVLGVVSTRLVAWPYRYGVLAVVVLIVLIALALAVAANAGLDTAAHWSLWRVGSFAALVAAFTLAYFRLRDRALSPALAEARLQALQARIRPHFLFNSLNAVLSLVRSEPRQAERALEDLSELFRAAMGEARRLVPLADEIALTKRYLALEQLRLGERLRVVWHIDKMPADALVPPLLIQPLVENAVYHGVEPAVGAGEIQMNLYRSQDKVHIVIKNPQTPGGDEHVGNRIALDNIRERLMLFFDLDASIKCEPLGAVYQVHVVLPYTRHAPPADR